MPLSIPFPAENNKPAFLENFASTSGSSSDGLFFFLLFFFTVSTAWPCKSSALR